MGCRRLGPVSALVVPFTAAWLAGPAEARAVEREALIFGAEVGVGWIQCDGCGTPAGLDAGFHAGWMLSPRLALIVDGAAVIHPVAGSGSVLVSSTGGIGVRYFAGDRVWLQAVFGVGGLDVALAGVTASTDEAAALAGALGVELVQTRKFALDLSGRVGTFKPDSSRITNLSVQLGLTWY